MQHLEARFREESQRKGQLEGDITALSGEIVGLKDETLKHALCQNGRIGRHLAHMMQQITQSNPATIGASSSSVSASSSTSSLVSAGLAMAAPPAAAPASLSDESLSEKCKVNERISGDLHGVTVSLESGVVDECDVD